VKANRVVPQPNPLQHSCLIALPAFYEPHAPLSELGQCGCGRNGGTSFALKYIQFTPLPCRSTSHTKMAAQPPSFAAANARPPVCYRLIMADEWAVAQASGGFAGSGIDVRDGYIHMSVGDEVKRTARLYFRGQAGLVLLKIGAWKATVESPRRAWSHASPRARQEQQIAG
jgi:uncharacterized protein (DUF952 family)